MVDKPENTDSRTVINYGTEIAGVRHEDLPEMMKMFWILIGVLVTCFCIRVMTFTCSKCFCFSWNWEFSNIFFKVEAKTFYLPERTGFFGDIYI